MMRLCWALPSSLSASQWSYKRPVGREQKSIFLRRNIEASRDALEEMSLYRKPNSHAIAAAAITRLKCQKKPTSPAWGAHLGVCHSLKMEWHTPSTLASFNIWFRNFFKLSKPATSRIPADFASQYSLSGRRWRSILNVFNRVYRWED